MTKIRAPETLDQRFRELADDDATVRAKFVNFSMIIHDEQKAVALKAKSLWAQTIHDLGLEGEWRYEDGWFLPVDPTPVT